MKTKALIYIILAGVLWGTSCIFVNNLAPYGISSIQMTGARGTVAFICMALFCLIMQRDAFKTNLKSLLLYIGSGASLFVTATLYYASMQMTSVSTAVMLLYMAPMLVMLVSVLFLDERLTKIKLIAVAVMLLGCILVSGVIGGLHFDAIGILLGILSAFTYAVYNVLTKIQMRKGDNPYTATLYTFLVITLISLVTADPIGLFGIVAENTLSTLPLLLGIGICTFVIPYFLYTASLKTLSAGAASTLSIIEPMSASVFSIIIFGEQLTVFSGLGILLVIIAVILISLGEHKHHEDSPRSEAAKKECI